MSGGGRLAVCAWAATLCAGSALLPLVEPIGWLFQAAIMLAVVSAVGAAARRVPVARPLTVAAQALVALVALTLVFAHSHAIGGVLPGPGVFREFGQLLQEGVDDVGRYAIPAPVTAGIRLLLVGGVLVVGLIVDALAVTYRGAAPAGLPLLALYSVAAGLSRGGADWLWFLLAAGGYLLLLLAEGRDRLSRWGRVFGGAPAGAFRSPGPASTASGSVPAPVRTGRRIGALALGIALVVPAALPSLGGGLLRPGGPGAGPGGRGGTISAVNPLVSLQNSLNQPEDKEVLRYRTTTDDTRDLYLRFVALDQFDGTAWKPSQRAVMDVPDRLPPPPGLGPDVNTTKVVTSVSTADWYAQSWLPLPYPASKVGIGGRWRFEPEGRTLVGDRGQNTRGARYEVESLVVRPTARQLSTAPPPPAELKREYTEVPGNLPEVVRETALRVTAGSSSAYEGAVKLQDWFALDGGFSYNTEVRAGSGVDAIARFLSMKEGFCVHFAFSMAAMARTLGIPARVAVGFTPGTRQADGSTSVGLKDAHAWPELYFEGVGWTRFEPTPSRGTAPDYTVTDTPTGRDPNVPATRPSASAEPSTDPSRSAGCAPDRRNAGVCGPLPSEQGAGPGGASASAGTVVGVTAAAILALLIPLLPLLWRIRVRARRLGGRHAGPDGAGGARRTLAAWEELVDSGWDLGIPPDDSLTPRKAAARLVRVGVLDGGAADSAHRVASAVEQVLYAPNPRPTPGLADDVRRVRAGLRAAASWRLRVRALLAPRSAARAVRAASIRWSAALHRCATSRAATAVRHTIIALTPARRRA